MSKVHIGKLGGGTRPVCGATGFGGGISVSVSEVKKDGDKYVHAGQEVCKRCVAGRRKRLDKVEV